MLPNFPEFKNISIDDRSLVERFTFTNEPYSDFNFTNLWTWDIEGVRRISQLNGNLVVIFTDYQTNKSLLSFLGKNNVEDTVRKLLNYADSLHMQSSLSFISEEVAKGISVPDITVIEDPDNFDYIFSVAELAACKGVQFKKKRHLSRRFSRDNPDAEFALRDITDMSVQNDIRQILHTWSHKKKNEGKHYQYEFEEQALERLLSTASLHNVITSTVTLSGKMIAFSIDEVLPNGYALAHFLKADNSYKGVYEYLNENTARSLEREGVSLWNWEQDLNIDGLRKLKMSYRPVKFLKKYKVFMKNDKEKTFSKWFKKISMLPFKKLTLL